MKKSFYKLLKLQPVLSVILGYAFYHEQLKVKLHVTKIKDEKLLKACDELSVSPFNSTKIHFKDEDEDEDEEIHYPYVIVSNIL